MGGVDWMLDQPGSLAVIAHKDSFEKAVRGKIRVSVALTRRGFEEPPINLKRSRAERLVTYELHCDLWDVDRGGGTPSLHDLNYLQLASEPGSGVVRHMRKTLDPVRLGVSAWREVVCRHMAAIPRHQAGKVMEALAPEREAATWFWRVWAVFASKPPEYGLNELTGIKWTVGGDGTRTLTATAEVYYWEEWDCPVEIVFRPGEKGTGTLDVLGEIAALTE